MRIIGSKSIYFSYGQFVVYDDTEKLPGSCWDDRHIRQGFVRRRNAIGFSTILEFGTALLRVYSGEINRTREYARVVRVPLETPSGKVRFEGPEEYPIDRYVSVAKGVSLITVAQFHIDEGSIQLDLYIVPVIGKKHHSSIIVSEAGMSDVVITEDGKVAC
jgi:hypothetical protein